MWRVEKIWFFRGRHTYMYITYTWLQGVDIFSSCFLSYVKTISKSFSFLSPLPFKHSLADDIFERTRKRGFLHLLSTWKHIYRNRPKAAFFFTSNWNSSLLSHKTYQSKNQCVCGAFMANSWKYEYVCSSSSSSSKSILSSATYHILIPKRRKVQVIKQFWTLFVVDVLEKSVYVCKVDTFGFIYGWGKAAGIKDQWWKWNYSFIQNQKHSIPKQNPVLFDSCKLVLELHRMSDTVIHVSASAVDAVENGHCYDKLLYLRLIRP